jgi:D-alanyl-D-alanine carboxypeptidase
MPTLRTAFQRLDQFVEQQMDANALPGLALAITDRAQLVYLATYGLADIGQKLPVTPETLFEIGSISKSFTAVAILQQCDQGRLDLHVPVSHYMPWFQVYSPYDPITIHHLLSHTAGIPSGMEGTPGGRYEVFALRETTAFCPPGERFHYSNLGYEVLGYLLEDVLGHLYERIVQWMILDPLGMQSTVPVVTHDTRLRLAVGYQRLYDDRPSHRSHPLVPAPWREYGRAAGSIAATVGDMAAYCRMLLRSGEGPTDRLLSADSFARMTQRIVEVDDDHYGYGLYIREQEGQQYIGHGGGMLGYRSSMTLNMDAGVGVVVLTNGDSSPYAISRFGFDLLRAVRRAQPLPPLPERPDPTRIQNASEYAGSYSTDEKTLLLVAQEDQLFLTYRGRNILLELCAPDVFYVPHSDFALYYLRFGRDNAQVVEAFYGSDWYANQRYTGPTTFLYPPAWEAYPGHYRSHSPGISNFRIVLRKGELAVVAPWWIDEQVLIPVAEEEFRVGSDEVSPDHISFSAIVNDQAQKMTFAGAAYYRTFTP